MVYKKYHEEPWYGKIRYQLEIRYYAIENRMIESFGFVTPDTDNRSVHSYTFASILRDAGSLFDSVLKKMIEESGKTYDDRIYGCLKFLEEQYPNIEKRTITLRSNLKTLKSTYKKTCALVSIPSTWFLLEPYREVNREPTGSLQGVNKEKSRLKPHFFSKF